MKYDLIKFVFVYYMDIICINCFVVCCNEYLKDRFEKFKKNVWRILFDLKIYMLKWGFNFYIVVWSEKYIRK